MIYVFSAAEQYEKPVDALYPSGYPYKTIEEGMPTFLASDYYPASSSVAYDGNYTTLNFDDRIQQVSARFFSFRSNSSLDFASVFD